MYDAETAKLMRAKHRLVLIKQVPASKDQPLQVELRRNGVYLYGAKTMLEIEAYLMKVSIETLMGNPVKRKHSR